MIKQQKRRVNLHKLSERVFQLEQENRALHLKITRQVERLSDYSIVVNELNEKVQRLENRSFLRRLFDF